MSEPRNPKEMGLGEIVRELNLLMAVRTLSTVIGNEKAYTRAPSYCQNPNDLYGREDQLYTELNDSYTKSPAR